MRHVFKGANDHYIDIPDGWHAIDNGIVMDGDRIAVVPWYEGHDKLPFFRKANHKSKETGSHVKCFHLVIRKAAGQFPTSKALPPTDEFESVNISHAKIKELQELTEVPHEHCDGMNECHICDEPIVDAAIRELNRLKVQRTCLWRPPEPGSPLLAPACKPRQHWHKDWITGPVRFCPHCGGKIRRRTK